MPDKNSNLPSLHPETQPGYFNEADDEISLKDLILTLWHYRKIMVVLSLCVTFIIAALALAILIGDMLFSSQQGHLVSSKVIFSSDIILSLVQNFRKVQILI